MRTYGFREAAYREAREQGVLFVRYEPEQPPECWSPDGKLRLKCASPALGRDLVLQPDLVVLAAPLVPRADRGEMSELLRVPLNADGFFLEAHMKLRPVDFASEGCSSAARPTPRSSSARRSPRPTRWRAGRPRSCRAKKMPVGGQIAWVDPDKCISCMTCVHVCPYMAPQVGENNKAEVQGPSAWAAAVARRSAPPRPSRCGIRRRPDPGGGEQPAWKWKPSSRAAEPAYPEQVGVAPPRWQVS